jgi:hypothetical protein
MGVGELAVVGVDDPSLRRADLRCVPPRADRRFTLLLAHAPNILDHVEAHHAIDLILCTQSWRIMISAGHAAFWLPPGCNGRVAGWHELGKHKLYINRGLGWSFLLVLPLELSTRDHRDIVNARIDLGPSYLNFTPAFVQALLWPGF